MPTASRPPCPICSKGVRGLRAGESTEGAAHDGDGAEAAQSESPSHGTDTQSAELPAASSSDVTGGVAVASACARMATNALRGHMPLPHCGDSGDLGDLTVTWYDDQGGELGIDNIDNSNLRGGHRRRLRLADMGTARGGGRRPAQRVPGGVERRHRRRARRR